MFCQRYSCLPGPGGLLDQDALIMQRLVYVANAYAEVLDKQQKALKKDL